MKFSLKHLLLLVATVAMSTLSADKAAVAAQSDVVVLAEQPATREAVAVDAKSEATPEETRFIRTTNAALKYIIKNRAFVVKRFTRDIIHKLLSDHLAPILKGHVSADPKENKYFSFEVEEQKGFFGSSRSIKKDSIKEIKKDDYDKRNETHFEGQFAPQGEAGELFRHLLVDNILKSGIIAGLDASIKTEEEHWALSMACAAFFEYYVKDGSFWDAAREAVEDYLTSGHCAQHLGKHDWLWYVIPYFIGSLKKGYVDFDPAMGLSYNIGGFLAFNPNTRIPSFFAKGSFGDNFVKNLIGRALVPGFLNFVSKNHNKGYKVSFTNGERNKKYGNASTDSSYIYRKLNVAQPTAVKLGVNPSTVDVRTEYTI